jgi:hypothetical protein
MTPTHLQTGTASTVSKKILPPSASRLVAMTASRPLRFPLDLARRCLLLQISPLFPPDQAPRLRMLQLQSQLKAAFHMPLLPPSRPCPCALPRHRCPDALRLHRSQSPIFHPRSRPEARSHSFLLAYQRCARRRLLNRGCPKSLRSRVAAPHRTPSLPPLLRPSPCRRCLLQRQPSQFQLSPLPTLQRHRSMCSP